jgi:hypothetical protein
MWSPYFYFCTVHRDVLNRPRLQLLGSFRNLTVRISENNLFPDPSNQTVTVRIRDLVTAMEENT